MAEFFEPGDRIEHHKRGRGTISHRNQTLRVRAAHWVWVEWDDGRRSYTEKAHLSVASAVDLLADLIS